MNKIDNIPDYFSGTRALYYYFIGEMENNNVFKNFILDKKNQTYATVSLISVLMTGIKEDMVNSKGNLIFESKLLLDSLEKSVNIIARKTENGYILDGKEFKDAATIVGIIRNKLAHGNFTVDYINKKVIFNHEGEIIKVKIDKLSAFVVSGIVGTLKNEKTKVYERNFCGCNKFEVYRNKPIKTVIDVKNIFRNTYYYNFILTTDDEFVPQLCIDKVEEYIAYYGANLNSDKLYKLYLELEKFLNTLGCTLKIEKKKVYSENLEKKIIEYADKFLIGNDNLDYATQLTAITNEVLKFMNPEYKKFDPIFSNVKLLIILDAIDKTDSYDRNVISKYLKEKGYESIDINYDVLGAILFSMFNSLYIYGFDDIYTSSGGYKLDRSNEFDFSLLNFKNIKPIIDGIDYTPLEDALKAYKKAKREVGSLIRNLEKSKKHLNSVSSNESKNKISNLINEISNDLKVEQTALDLVEDNYLKISEDYKNNFNYFKNRAIINGIRNSIAHGNYEIILGDHIATTKIIFKDIYEGKETFKIELTYSQFSEMIEDNYYLIYLYLEKLKGQEQIKDIYEKIKSLTNDNICDKQN